MSTEIQFAESANTSFKHHGEAAQSHRVNGAAAVVSLDDERVIAAVREYLRLLEAGQKPNRGEFLSRHAEIAEALSGCLAGLEFVQGAAAEISGPHVFVGGPGDGGDQIGPLGPTFAIGIKGRQRRVAF
jgi:hypothetical protein